MKKVKAEKQESYEHPSKTARKNSSVATTFNEDRLYINGKCYMRVKEGKNVGRNGKV